ncbi:unnamed protein product [Effrenium voratum]|nr:unnamed protein product [Effrenium voratum]
MMAALAVLALAGVLRFAGAATTGQVLVGQLQDLKGPMGVTLTDVGLVVVDTDNHRVLLCPSWQQDFQQSVCKLVAGTGSSGFEASELRTPYTALAQISDAGLGLIIADTHNHRVQFWAPGASEGITLVGGLGFGAPGYDGPGELEFPTGLAMDEVRGFLFVADTGHHRVVRYPIDLTAMSLGAGITVAGTSNMSGSAGSLLDNPTAIAYRNDRLYVADARNSRVMTWLVRPELVDAEVSARRLSSIDDFDDNETSDVNASTTSATQTSTTTRSTSTITTITVTTTTTYTGPRYMLEMDGFQGRPYGVVAAEDSIYVADADGCMVWKKLYTGEKSVVVGSACGGSLNQIFFPGGIGVEQTGAIVIADSRNNRVIRFGPEPLPLITKCTLGGFCEVTLRQGLPTRRSRLALVKRDVRSVCGGRCIVSGLGGGTWVSVPASEPPYLSVMTYKFGVAGYGETMRCSVALGLGHKDLPLDLHQLCEGSGSVYLCNRTLTPGCADLCEEREAFASYLDEVMSSNPFGYDEPWLVPQVDLSEAEAFIFMSQRQALYVAMRLLAMKMRGIEAPVNALSYGLTHGCNWHPVPPSIPPGDCRRFAPLSGVSVAGVQGNVFSLLAWARALSRENGACYARRSDRPRWCPHDSVVAAVRGGLSGPDTKERLDTGAFWAQQDVPLSAKGVRPNVCHFEASDWVWRNALDAAPGNFCKGAREVPGIYSEEVADFMSKDRPFSLAVDIAGAQYGGGCGSASGQTWGTQDESTPVFYPETLALGFHSTGRSIGTGSTALLFLGVRRYFSGQSGSHGRDRSGLQTPLFNSGNSCGSLRHARVLDPSQLLADSAVVQLTSAADVRMFAHSLGVVTSSCGTCLDGNPPNTTHKFKTSGETCLVSWQQGRSTCAKSPEGGWTYWKDVWTWMGALHSDFYPQTAQPAIRALLRRVQTGPWGAGVWWGNTLQYFVVVWLGTFLLGLQLDYYAYGLPAEYPEVGWPLGGFCEQYQAQGFTDVVQNLELIENQLAGLRVKELYAALQSCSRCEEDCSFVGVGPKPSEIYCQSPCTEDFLRCFLAALQPARLQV